MNILMPGYAVLAFVVVCVIWSIAGMLAIECLIHQRQLRKERERKGTNFIAFLEEPKRDESDWWKDKN